MLKRCCRALAALCFVIICAASTPKSNERLVSAVPTVFATEIADVELVFEEKNSDHETKTTVQVLRSVANDRLLMLFKGEWKIATAEMRFSIHAVSMGKSRVELPPGTEMILRRNQPSCLVLQPNDGDRNVEDLLQEIHLASS